MQHKLEEGEFKDVKFDDVLNKLKILTHTSNAEELAEWLGVSRSIISDARRKNVIPKSWILNLLLKSDKVPSEVTTFLKDLTLYLGSKKRVHLL